MTLTNYAIWSAAVTLQHKGNVSAVMQPNSNRHYFPWLLSPGKGGSTGVRVRETPHSKRKEWMDEGG